MNRRTPKGPQNRISSRRPLGYNSRWIMANADTAATASDRLLELVGRLERQEGFAEVVESLTGGHAATLDGVWGSSCALAAAALAAHAPAALVVVCPQVDQVDELIDDLALFTRLRPGAVSGLGIVGAASTTRCSASGFTLLKRLGKPSDGRPSCRRQHPKSVAAVAQPRNARSANPPASCWRRGGG